MVATGVVAGASTSSPQRRPPQPSEHPWQHSPATYASVAARRRDERGAAAAARRACSAALLSKRLPLCTTRGQSFCHTLAPFSAWLSRKYDSVTSPARARPSRKRTRGLSWAAAARGCPGARRRCRESVCAPCAQARGRRARRGRGQRSLAGVRQALHL